MAVLLLAVREQLEVRVLQRVGQRVSQHIWFGGGKQKIGDELQRSYIKKQGLLEADSNYCKLRFKTTNK